MDKKFKYNRGASTSLQATAQRVLQIMYRNHMEESFEIIDAPRPHDKEKIQIPWTAETLMNELKRWDSTLSLARVNEVLNVLMNSDLIKRQDGPFTQYELTLAGRTEAERLANKLS